MSVQVCVKGREGIVFAADSRYTLFDSAEPSECYEYDVLDGYRKVFTLGGPHRWVAGSLCWSRTDPEPNWQELVPEILAGLPSHRVKVSEYARRTHGVLARLAGRASLQAIVAGFDEGEDLGRVFAIEIPSSKEPVEQHAGAYGVTYGGQREYIDRILQGYDSLLSPDDYRARRDVMTVVPLSTMPLADCFELAVYLIRTTIGAQRFSLGMQGSGGPIDVMMMTAADGLLHTRLGKPEDPRSLRCDLRALPEIVTSMSSDISRLATYTVR